MKDQTEYVEYCCASCGVAGKTMRRRLKATHLCRGCAIRKPRSLEAQAKFRGTMLAKYGTANALCNPEIKQRLKEATLAKYGVANISQVAEVADKKRRPRLDIPPEVDASATKAEYGYEVNTLNRGSDLNVVVACASCHSVFSRAYRNVNSPVLCVKCVFNAYSETKRADMEAKRQATLLEKYPNGINWSSGGTSAAQHDIQTWLEATLGRSLQSEKRLKTGKRLDIYDPRTNLAIEYCGLFWHNEASPTPRDRFYHKNKMLGASAEGMRVVTVFEDEWLLRQDQAKSRLISIFGGPVRVIPGRKCVLSAIDSTESKAFINANHLQGLAVNTKASWGLFYLGELVAVLTLRHDYRAEFKSAIILNRLCFKMGTRVQGGAGKLLKAAMKWALSNSYTHMYTWSDSRWSDGALYKATGFREDRVGLPDYTYVVLHKPRERLPKESQKKSTTGCPATVTEHQWALQNGLVRIWDCGHTRWVIDL